MPKLRDNSPIRDNLVTGQCFTEHDGVHCYPAIHTQTGDKYIIKVVSIPASSVQTEALLLTGAIADAEDAKLYYHTLAQEVLAEANLLNELALLEGFVGCELVLLEENENADGYDVLLRSRYRESVEMLLRKEPMTHLAAINMGLDLCVALAACRRAGYVFVDLKPDNVFLTEVGSYCIGDIGFVPLKSLKYASLPQKYRSSYTAPEMADCFAQLNETLDIYALGLMLYQAYNGGSLPFEGQAIHQVLPPPLYADYELSEIILKACAPDVADRWQDPAQFGQALTLYMQRNSVNDTPIVPQEGEEEVLGSNEEAEQPEEFLPEMSAEELETALEEEARLQDAEQDELQMIATLAADSDGDADDLLMQEEPSDAETAEILAQAEELMTLVPPEPVVAPEAVSVSLPVEETDQPDEEPPVETDMEVTQGGAVPEQSDPEAVPRPRLRAKKQKEHHIGKLLALLLVLLLLCGAAFGGYYYYNNYYLQYIHGIQITGTDDTVVVTVLSDIDPSLLHLSCTDSYGNSHPGMLSDGKIVFENLKPQTRYMVSVSISGFHELRGETVAHFTTASRTEILSLQAIVGPYDGSAIISFMVSGPEPKGWNVICTAPGQETITQRFIGTNVTVTGLHVGSEYTFTLVPEDDLYLAGQTEIRFKAVNILLAKDPIIDTCHDGMLHVTWSAPENEAVEFWTVRCFNAAGYDVSITTTDTEYTFTGVDHSAATTVEIIAAGMTKSVTATVGPNPITILSFETANADSGGIKLSWNFTDHAPQGGWNIHWTVDGIKQSVIHTDTAVVDIDLLVPGSTYEFILEAADRTQLFGSRYTFQLPQSHAFQGFGIEKSDLQHVTFRAPLQENWTWEDITSSLHTDTFQPGEKIFVLFSSSLAVAESDATVLVNLVLKDNDGRYVQSTAYQQTWNSLWTDDHMILELPAPLLPGNYDLHIYIDGMHLGQIPYSIQ